MFNNRLVVEFLKRTLVSDGYNNILRATFSMSSKSDSSQSSSSSEGSLAGITMAHNMFSNTESLSSTPLVIMHGLLGSKQNWRTISKVLLKKLSPSRTIFTVDARNHGESPHTSEHNYDYLASDILEFLRQHSIDKAILMGHSMGGRAMMNFALKHPDLVEKLIVVDISPVNRSQSLEGMEKLLRKMKNVQVPVEMQMKDARKIVLDELSTVVDRGTADFVLLNLKKLSDGSIVWTPNLNVLEKNLKHIRTFPEINKQYMGPTLFIGGTKSDFIHKDDLKEIKKFFPNATLEWIDAGHVIHFEKPADFVEIITKFINS